MPQNSPNQNQKEEGILAFSIPYFQSILMVGLFLAFAGITGYQVSHQGSLFSSDISGIAHTQRDAEYLLEKLKKKETSLLEEKLTDTPGAEAFLSNAKKWKNIENIRVDATSEGIYLSLEATRFESSVLHRYYGFFHKSDDLITHVTWGGNTTGKVLTRRETETDKNYIALTVKNTGPLPWDTQNAWRNITNGEAIILLAEDEDKEMIPVGEKGIFVLKKSETVSLKNKTHGFLVNFEGDVPDF